MPCGTGLGTFFSEQENFGEIVTYSLNLYTFLFIKHFSMEIGREISTTLENLPNPAVDATCAANVISRLLCLEWGAHPQEGSPSVATRGCGSEFVPVCSRG